MRVLVAAISLLLTLFSATSHAWLNEDWSARKKITLTNKAGEVADAPAFSGERVAASFANGGAKLNGSQSLTLPAINAAGGMSVAMWLKPAALDGALIQASGLTAALAGGVLNVQAGAANVTASVPLTVGKWHYLTITVDNTLKVYIDGKLAGEAAGAALPVGALSVGPGYNGELDEVG